MGTTELSRYLREKCGDYLRGIVRYDRDSTDTLYLRDDIREVRLQSQIDRMLHRLKPEAGSKEERSFPFGDLHTTLRCFDEAIIMHFPTGVNRGVVVSLEPETARQLNTFVGKCLSKLGS